MNTAVLIFSRTACEEAAGKRYGGGFRRNIRVAQHLIAHTEKAARFSGLTVIRKYSGSQQGLNFGERFANAIESVFAQGFSRIITIGTDTPGISSGILRGIDKRLQDQTLVTGPSPDGGVYAIGLARDGWDRTAFVEIKWQTEAVQDGLSAYSLALHLAHHTLAPLRDIDNGAAFNEWLHHAGAHTAIIHRICAALAAPRPLYCEARAALLTPAFPQEARRGPPVAA